jgi:dTDP-4-dehydrorhamnose reductase
VKILVLGATGMLGHKCIQQLRDVGNVLATARRELTIAPKEIYEGATIINGVDASDFVAIKQLLQTHKPNVVINAMGIIKQRDEAKEAVVSININSLLPHVLADVCEDIGAYLITFSTDCVFSCEANAGPYSESHIPDPRDLYGRSKLLGEVAREHCLTLRMSIVGRELYTPKRSLFEWIFDNAGKDVKGYTKAMYTGFTTLEITNIVRMLLARKERLHGVWHIASPEISKYDLLIKMNSLFDLDMHIEPHDGFVCDRRLDASRFNAETGYKPPSWDEMLSSVQNENGLYR